MTCCILAALVISQVLAYRDRIKRFFGFEMDDDEEGATRPLREHGCRGLSKAVIPATVLAIAIGMGVWHWDHFVGLIAPAAHAAGHQSALGLCTSRLQQPQFGLPLAASAHPGAAQ